ncbi:SMC-Scp complex subunit ScpB [uncultured Methanofollis sp.]|uniref:SMC-Scp complex subunit ScpB n=1 Tax=uncultured Methanofollis sp. TaxID=262500 RepID=UPI002634290A|nr:SMC-Scp complex subunit ScpB [uncultured Methanofollis sp.]
MDRVTMLEAILFVADAPIDYRDLERMLGVRREEVSALVAELAGRLVARASPLEILDAGESVFMVLKEEFSDLVYPLLRPEISRAVLRTLSVIAYRQPILQSELVEIRGSGAYAHVDELIRRSLVARQREGRSYVLQTTPEFSRYFKTADLTGVQERLDTS